MTKTTSFFLLENAIKLVKEQAFSSKVEHEPKEDLNLLFFLLPKLIKHYILAVDTRET